MEPPTIFGTLVLAKQVEIIIEDRTKQRSYVVKNKPAIHDSKPNRFSIVDIDKGCSLGYHFDISKF